MPEPRVIAAQPGPQTAFLSTPADIAIYGGGAGSGKTWAELFEPLRHIHNPAFGAVTFRRTYPQIRNVGGLWDESTGLYPLVGGVPAESRMEWTFPSGATCRFAHLQHEKSKYDWQGSQVPLFCFDELTHFLESVVWYMLSRNRSTCGVRPYMRATTNADASSWVAKLIEWWIDQETGYAIPERSGVLRYFLRVAGTLVWSEDPRELEHAYPDLCKDAPPKSLTYIAASIFDNPALLDKDPGYLASLLALPPVDQARLLGDRTLGANWKVMAGGGTVFDRKWFTIIDEHDLAPGGVECRFWDFAATEYEEVKQDKPFTAGWKMVKQDTAHGPLYTVTDVVAAQKGPTEIDELFFETTRADAAAARIKGRRYLSRWELEGGSAGKKDAARMIRALDGIDAGPVKPEGEKLIRAKPLAVQAKAGAVRFVKAPWNEEVLQHLHQQPDWPIKDIMDAGSGCHDVLVNTNASEGSGWARART